jgi:putative flippase GtrA
MTARVLTGQMVRYTAVGLLVLALDYAVFAGLNMAFTGQHLFANIAGKLTGAAAGFVLHKYISFAGAQAASTQRQALSYAMLLAFNLLLSSTLLLLLVDWLALNAFAARLVVDAIIIGVSFLGSKFWVYKAL